MQNLDGACAESSSFPSSCRFAMKTLALQTTDRPTGIEHPSETASQTYPQAFSYTHSALASDGRSRPAAACNYETSCTRTLSRPSFATLTTRRRHHLHHLQHGTYLLSSIQRLRLLCLWGLTSIRTKKDTRVSAPPQTTAHPGVRVRRVGGTFRLKPLLSRTEGSGHLIQSAISGSSTQVIAMLGRRTLSVTELRKAKVRSPPVRFCRPP